MKILADPQSPRHASMSLSRRAFLGAAASVAALGAAVVPARPEIARLVAEFDEALDRSIRAEKDYNTDRPDADFDADCEAEDAFSKVFVAAMHAGERLAEAVQAIDPDASALLTPTALYVFGSEVDGCEDCVRRIERRAMFTL